MLNRYQINVSTLPSGTTATTINIPIMMEYQLVDQAELIERVFVDTEVEKAINPILDYDRVRFVPTSNSGQKITMINYVLQLLDANSNYTGNYGGIGFEYDDVKFRKNSFFNSFVRLSFFDSDDPYSQNLVAFTTLFCNLKPTDLEPTSSSVTILGLPKPINQIPINFLLEDPLINRKGFAEGFHLYYYKDSLNIGDSKYLYMRASFMNAKSGKQKNLMVKNTPQKIEDLVHEVYTRYKITRTTTGYYYEIDDTYRVDPATSMNNVSYSTVVGGNEVTVNLYEIKAL